MCKCLKTPKEVRKAVLAERRALLDLVVCVEHFEAEEDRAELYAVELARRFALAELHEDAIREQGYELPEWEEYLLIDASFDEYPAAVSAYKEVGERRRRAA